MRAVSSRRDGLLLVSSHKFAIVDSRRCGRLQAATATEDLMAAERLAPLILSDDERAELQSLTMRRKTAQALALRARIVLSRSRQYVQ